MKNLLHKLGLHFYKESGNISRTCTVCEKKQYLDYFYGGGWIDAELCEEL